MAYLRHTLKLHNFKDLTNNNFHLKKSAMCHEEIENYNSNYKNKCSIMTIIIIKNKLNKVKNTSPYIPCIKHLFL